MEEIVIMNRHHVGEFPGKLHFTYWRGLLIFLFLGFSQLSGFAQLQKYQFRHINLSDGLSDATVYDIIQDHQGFIWIATRNGLNRYDGNRLTVYESDKKDTNSVSSNYISRFCVTHEGTLWVGTNYGLNCYDSTTDKFSRYFARPDDPESLSDNSINSIFEDSKGRLWIGTNNGLNLVVSGNPIRFRRFLASQDTPGSLTDSVIYKITEDKFKNLWIGTNSGISKLSEGNVNDYKFVNYNFPDLIQQTGKGLDGMSMIEDANGLLWIGRRSNGIIFFNPKTQKFINDVEIAYHLPVLTNKDIHCLQNDGKESIWLGFNDGLYLYNIRTNQSSRFLYNPDNTNSINDNAVQSIYIDKKGTLWVGTFFAGVNFCNPSFVNFIKLYPENLNDRFIIRIGNSLLEDYRGNLWVGSEGQGLFMHDRLTQNFRNYVNIPDENSSISQNNVKCMLEDGQKGIWIGTLAGLNYYNYSTRKFTRFLHDPHNPKSISGNRVYDIKRDKNGALWVGFTPGGLSRFEPEKKEFYNYPIEESNPIKVVLENVTNLYFDKGDTLWIGGFRGIGCKLPGKDEFVNFKVNNQPLNSFCYIYSIFQDSKSRIWIGTSWAGLALFNREKQQFETVFSGAADKNLIVNGIEEDGNGKLWLSTNNFVYQFNPDTKEVRHFDQYDGIFCRKFSNKTTLKTRQGYIYMTGYDGVFGFDPNSIRQNNEPPPVALTRLNLFGKEVKIGGDDKLLDKQIDITTNLTFDYTQNIFSVEFAALNYINPEKNNFGYQLEGFDKDWNYVTKPVATYMNLPPGSYTLLVKAANNDNIWNQNLKQLHIRILPPPWKSWWAILIYSLIFAVTLIMWARITEQKYRLKHMLQLKSAENRKQEELHQSKLRFFTNVAHEIRTPLTLILGPLEEILDFARENTHITGQLQTIRRNANQLLRLVNQLLDFQKHETWQIKLSFVEADLIAYLNEIAFSFQDYAQIRKVELRLVSAMDQLLLWFDKEELEKVFFNLLSNALKFTPPGGQITIDVKIDQESNPEMNSSVGNSGRFVVVSVSDNGIGIPANQLDKVFERYYTINNKNLEPNSGFGIGLSLSRSIVELHSGRIWVESQKEDENQPNSTTFFVKLPLESAHIEKAEIDSDLNNYKRTSSFPAMEGPTIFGGEYPPKQSKLNSKLILIIEDNEEIRLFLKQQLEKKYKVIEAVDGLAGWNLAISELPEIVVSDILMPRLDGLELTSRLKADERTSHIPVILLTARNTNEQQLEGLITGADDYVTKPFSANILLAKINNLLGMREKLKQRYSRIFTVEPSPTEIENPDEKFLVKLMLVIEGRITDQKFSINDLAEEIGMSRSVLFRKVKALTGEAIVDLIISVRLKKAAILLKQKKLGVTEVAYMVGFSDAKYFSRSFKEQFGKTPTDFMNAQKDSPNEI